jgi:hypothetical protein
MERTAYGKVLAGFAALALTVSALGPCHCLVGAAACHREAQEADAHACCEDPPGVQAVADECCDTAPVLVVAHTDVPEVAPPTLQAGPVADLLPSERSTDVAAVRTPPPVPLDQKTVLLI